MNVLYCCTDPGIDLGGQGGGAIHIRATVRALTRLGHAVTVVSSSVTDPSAVSNNLQALVRPAPLSRWNRGMVRLIQTGNQVAGRPIRQHPDLARALHNVSFAKVADAAIRQAKPDFIYE